MDSISILILVPIVVAHDTIKSVGKGQNAQVYSYGTFMGMIPLKVHVSPAKNTNNNYTLEIVVVLL